MNAIDSTQLLGIAWHCAPLIVILIGAIAALLTAVFAHRDARVARAVAWISLGTLAASFMLTWFWWLSAPDVSGGMIAVDRISLIAWLIISFVAALVVLLSITYLPEGHHVWSEYYALLLFSTFGAGLLAAAANIVTIVIGLETAALSAYALAGIMRYRAKCNEASIKYFIIGSFALAFIVMGAAFLFGSTGSLDLTEIGNNAAAALQSDRRSFFLIGSAALIVGFCMKVAAVPFHAWAPDVYDGAPTPITAFIAGVLKLAAFVAFMRLGLAAFGHIGQAWVILTSGLAIATMFLGNLAAIAQENIKRLLAYSSIAHAGYILIAFPALATSHQAVGPVLFYLIAYALMTTGAFAVVVALNEGHEEHLGIASLAGLGRRQPAMAAALALFLISLAGFPPTFGFFAKYYLFLFAVRSGFTWLAVIAVINTAISVYFYLRPVVVMYFHDERAAAHDTVPASISTAVIAVIFLCALAVVFFGILPGNLMQLVVHSV